ncbi:hypothetical protein [Pseudogracilibacillus auburnensis]|uniref:hypothetical protein n=1 Tax=Pseudogracilibacillus auburnensis TaxID=1494959 RepID=UPI001A97446E|nr:hypothetical protein [Pseudogracilibacillus auburnensis]MBO1005764.1 hypothetical protein [Pseudogracilibacillus auburnensis]
MSEVKNALKVILEHEAINKGHIDLQACLSKILNEEEMKLLGFEIKYSKGDEIGECSYFKKTTRVYS